MRGDKLHTLSTKMSDLAHKGCLTEEEHLTYKWLLAWLEFTSCYVGDRLPIGEARKVREQLNNN